MARRKKTRRRPQTTLSDADIAALFDRIFVGFACDDPGPAREAGSDRVAFYWLNPGVAGPFGVIVDGVSTRPLFEAVPTAHDDAFRTKCSASLAEPEVIPFWMGRFMVSLDDSLVLGYTFAVNRRSAYEVRVINVDYNLAGEMFGSNPKMWRRAPIASRWLLTALESSISNLSASIDAPVTLTNMIAVDGGIGSFQTRGGLA